MGTFFRGRHPITYERGFVQGAGQDSLRACWDGVAD